jgi:hypothetical protein
VLTLFERRLQAEFVDRDLEMRRFHELLDSSEKHVMLVWGESGVGKSSLLGRMIHECAQLKWRKAEVVWTPPVQPHDHISIMRKIRDDVGVDDFKAFTELLNFFTVPRYELNIKVEGKNSIEVATGSQFHDSVVRDIVGFQVKDFYFDAPRPDMEIPDHVRRGSLTDCFIKDLNKVVEQSSLVVFCDSIEKCSVSTESWTWTELLPALYDERLRNTKFVMCGQRRPELDQMDRGWPSAIEEAQLGNLELEHIMMYLEKRGVPEADRRGVAIAVHAASGGKISVVAQLVESVLKMLRSQPK